MNEKQKAELIGKFITLYLDGGWEVSGEVTSFGEETFMIESDGSSFVVFKNKISCFMMGKSKGSLGSEKITEPVEINAGANFPMNDLSYNESSMSLPKALLDAHDLDDDDDLSRHIKKDSFGQGNSVATEEPNLPKIEFRVEDDDSEK